MKLTFRIEEFGDSKEFTVEEEMDMRDVIENFVKFLKTHYTTDTHQITQDMIDICEDELMECDGCCEDCDDEEEPIAYVVNEVWLMDGLDEDDDFLDYIKENYKVFVINNPDIVGIQAVYTEEELENYIEGSLD